MSREHRVRPRPAGALDRMGMDRPARSTDDAELALRVTERQEWAFRELVERYSDMLRFQAHAFYAPGETYDDLLQAARVGLHKAALTYDLSRGCTFRTFAVRVVRAEIITAVVTATRRKHTPLNDSARLESAAPGSEGEEVLADVIAAPAGDEPEARVLAREELGRIVHIAETRLSELERLVLARRLRGLPLAACGEGLGAGAPPAKAADNALQRVKRKLAA